MVRWIIYRFWQRCWTSADDDSTEGVTRHLSGLRHGNYNTVRMVQSLATYTFWYT
jgi:hypothetical protein